MTKSSTLNQKADWLLLMLGLVMLFVPVFLIISKVLHYTHGVFMYPYDDTLIHLTLADNLLDGTWGINRNEFASASSSILYTLILALFRSFSKSVMIPFFVNCIAGVLALLSLHLWLKKQSVNFNVQAFIFLLVIFFTPLPLLVVSGMEHTLQCLFSFLFIFYFSDWLEEAKALGRERLNAKILIFAVLVSSIRYEGLFLIAIACFLLLVYKKIFQAVILGVVSLLPILIFGLVSLKEGNYFFPNSVLVKSGTFDYANLFQVAYTIVSERLMYARNGMAALATQRLLIIFPLVYMVFKKFLRPSYFFVLIFLFAATVLQLSFASTGYLYRYEAYLFFCSMIILPVIFYTYGKQVFLFFNSGLSKFFVLAVGFILFAPVVLRSMTALNKAATACINIYDQQYQMAMFTKTYYNQSTLALNDIGAVSYFTNAKIVDLWGLATIEVTKSKKRHYWSPNFLDSLCRTNGVPVAIIYDSWFPDALTKKWNKTASWQIQNNVICGDSKVSFYAIDSSDKGILRKRLEMFQPQLPSSVVVKYY